MDQKVASACGFSPCSVDCLHSGTDIEDLARRGGLPSYISPYRLGSFNGRLFIEASGHSTATVNSYVLFGFGKDVHDARTFSRRFPGSLNPVLLREKFRNFRWVSDRWLQTAIIDAAEATDHEQVAKELFLQLLEEAPELRQWLPWLLDDRPNLIKKGEVADRFQEELAKINKACRLKKMSLVDLRNAFPEFSLWQELEGLTPMQYQQFKRDVGCRGSWSVDQVRDCIANVMNTGSGYTVKTWITRFRKWKKTNLSRV
jgi:hypothetical protein